MSYSTKAHNHLSNSAVVPEVVYDVPKQRFPNLFSAVNSGISEEDGLATLTFKSIEYTKYAEQLELMRDVMFQDKPQELSRINEKQFKGEELLASLKKDLEAMKHEASSNPGNHQSITQLNNKLNELINILNRLF